MKNIRLSVVCPLIVLFCLSIGSYADTSINGDIKFDERILTKDGSYYWNRSTFNLRVKSLVSDQAAGFAEVRLQTYDHSRVSAGADLLDPARVSPLKLELREAYVDVFRFPFRNMDLRAGKQRIAWGTADKLNPTDNLNPYDFSDLLDFGEKVPTNAVRLTTYSSDNTLTLAFVPAFTPAIMPEGMEMFMAREAGQLLPPGVSLNSFESTVALPDADLENGMFGARLGRNIFGYDMSVSYFSGRDSIPNPALMTFTPVSPTQMDIRADIDYPRIGVLGWDLAGSVMGVGVWAEMAFISPRGLTQTIVSPFGVSTSETGEYTKYTLGCDYTFGNGVYLNAQMMHGFFDERGANLNNFVMTRIEKKVFDDKVKLAMNWVGEFGPEVKKLEGNIFGPQITWYPADATEVTLAAFALDGDEGTKFNMWKDLDQTALKVKYSF